MLKMRSIYSKPMFTHIRLATCDCDIFAAITFSYSVHTLETVTCDMRPRQIRPCSDFVTCRMRGGEGIGENGRG